MKTLAAILISQLKQILIGVIVIAINCSYGIDYENDNKPTSWEVLKSNDYIAISYKYSKDNFSDNNNVDNVYLQVKNKTNQDVFLQWNIEYWYNNNCIGCEKETLNKHSIVLKPNEIIDGLNKGEINQSLIVFSKKLNYKINTNLIKFNLKNVRASLIVS